MIRGDSVGWSAISSELGNEIANEAAHFPLRFNDYFTSVT